MVKVRNANDHNYLNYQSPVVLVTKIEVDNILTATVGNDDDHHNLK